MPLYLTRRVDESFSIYTRGGRRWARVSVTAGGRMARIKVEFASATPAIDGLPGEGGGSVEFGAPDGVPFTLEDQGGERWLRVKVMHARAEPLLSIEAPRNLIVNRDDGRPPGRQAAAIAA